ncbi:MAG: aldose 1-epimerase family protein [Phreatobacter sp.]|nr:aldose 1-epimerase family protein [Phreatobacter sp.]
MIHLRKGGSEAAISATGGELTRWSVVGISLLWPGDPSWWEGSAPILFPIVGWARNGEVRIDGIARPMGVHGFAGSRPFRVVEQGEASCRLELVDDAETRAVYPFGFSLSVSYDLTVDGLAIGFTITNAGDRPMPYALGFHPGFRWPLTGAQRSGHAVVFAEPEEPSVPVIAPGGLFSSQRRPAPLDGRRMALDDAVFAAEALCFLDARSRSWAFEAPDRSAIRMDLDGFPHLALWSKPGAPFVCLEAWTGHGDPVGFAGDLKDKPSMRILAPGEADHARAMLTFQPG